MGRNWEDAEDAILKQMIATHGKQWNLIATHLPKRSPSQVAARWEKCLDPSITKGPFTPDEDRLIAEYVRENGARGWPRITRILPHRSSKQCRERWFNHLDQSVSKGPWTPEEDELIYRQVKTIGGKWSQIAKMLSGRTDNAIKNRYNSSIAKRIQVDASGEEHVLPDSSRRQYKPKERPPPIVPPVKEEKKAPPPLQIASLEAPTPGSAIPFTPFSLGTPMGQMEGGMFSPGVGFQLPSGFLSPTSAGQQTPFGFLSPTPFKNDNNDVFKGDTPR